MGWAKKSSPNPDSLKREKRGFWGTLNGSEAPRIPLGRGKVTVNFLILN